MARHPDVPFWVQVGDVASNDGEYFTPLAPLYFIKGNNEDFDVIADGDGRAAAGAEPALSAERRPASSSGRGASRRSAARSRRAGTTRRPPRCRRRRGRRAASASVKLGKSRDDKRRHFVRDEVVACKALAGIDVFLTHEAPRPFYPAGPPHRRGQDGDQRSARGDAAAAAPLRPPPRVHRLGAAGRPVDRPRSRDQVVPPHRRRHAPSASASTHNDWLMLTVFRRPRRARPRVRRRHGDDALCQGRVHQQELRRAESVRSRTSWRRSTTSTSARAPTSSRPTRSARTASSSARSAWPTRCARSTSRACGSRGARRGGRALCGRADRSARDPHRAVGQDRRRRGARVLPRAGAGAARGRRRSVRPRDLPRPERDRRGHRRRPAASRTCRSSRR